MDTKPSELGKEGERKARLYLKKKGFKIQQIDWLANRDGVWISVEVKNKELYKPPPFLGTGLNEHQANSRMKLWKEKGIRAYLFSRDCSTGICYGQWLDVLLDGPIHITKKHIIIFPIESFEVLEEPPRKPTPEDKELIERIVRGIKNTNLNVFPP